MFACFPTGICPCRALDSAENSEVTPVGFNDALLRYNADPFGPTDPTAIPSLVAVKGEPNDAASSDAASSDTPLSDTPSSDTPSSDAASSDAASSDTPSSDAASSDAASSDTPSSDAASSDAASSDTPSSDAASSDAASSDTPSSDAASSDTPSSDKDDAGEEGEMLQENSTLVEPELRLLRPLAAKQRDDVEMLVERVVTPLPLLTFRRELESIPTPSPPLSPDPSDVSNWELLLSMDDYCEVAPNGAAEDPSFCDCRVNAVARSVDGNDEAKVSLQIDSFGKSVILRTSRETDSLWFYTTASSGASSTEVRIPIADIKRAVAGVGTVPNGPVQEDSEMFRGVILAPSEVGRCILLDTVLSRLVLVFATQEVAEVSTAALRLFLRGVDTLEKHFSRLQLPTFRPEAVHAAAVPPRFRKVTTSLGDLELFQLLDRIATLHRAGQGGSEIPTTANSPSSSPAAPSVDSAYFVSAREDELNGPVTTTPPSSVPFSYPDSSVVVSAPLQTPATAGAESWVKYLPPTPNSQLTNILAPAAYRARTRKMGRGDHLLARENDDARVSAHVNPSPRERRNFTHSHSRTVRELFSGRSVLPSVAKKASFDASQSSIPLLSLNQLPAPHSYENVVSPSSYGRRTDLQETLLLPIPISRSGVEDGKNRYQQQQNCPSEHSPEYLDHTTRAWHEAKRITPREKNQNKFSVEQPASSPTSVERVDSPRYLIHDDAGAPCPPISQWRKVTPKAPDLPPQNLWKKQSSQLQLFIYEGTKDSTGSIRLRKMLPGYTEPNEFIWTPSAAAANQSATATAFSRATRPLIPESTTPAPQIVPFKNGQQEGSRHVEGSTAIMSPVPVRVAKINSNTRPYSRVPPSATPALPGRVEPSSNGSAFSTARNGVNRSMTPVKLPSIEVQETPPISRPQRRPEGPLTPNGIALTDPLPSDFKTIVERFESNQRLRHGMDEKNKPALHVRLRDGSAKTLGSDFEHLGETASVSLVTESAESGDEPSPVAAKLERSPERRAVLERLRQQRHPMSPFKQPPSDRKWQHDPRLFMTQEELSEEGARDAEKKAALRAKMFVRTPLTGLVAASLPTRID